MNAPITLFLGISLLVVIDKEGNQLHMLTISYLTITLCIGISLLVVIDKEINCRTLALFPALANNIGFFAIGIISTFI